MKLSYKKVVCLLLINVIACSSSFAQDVLEQSFLEIKFKGAIVEPTCDLQMQLEASCQKFFKNISSDADQLMLALDQLQSFDQLEQNLKNYSSSTAELNLLRLKTETANLIVKYR